MSQQVELILYFEATPKREANLYRSNLDKYNELKRRWFRLGF